MSQTKVPTFKNFQHFGTEQARRNEIHIGRGGGTKRGASKASKNGGPGPGKFLMNTPFRSLENAPFLENMPLTEAKDHD